MASVIRKLWGLNPPFLQIKPRKSLYQLIRQLPDHGKGTFVQPSEWFQQGRTKNFYKVTRVIHGTGKVYGIRYRQGVKASPEQLISERFKNWGRFYMPRTLERIQKVQD